MHHFRRLWPGILAGFVLCFGAEAQQAPKLRLGEVQEIRPTNYQVDLHLDPANPAFQGSIDIAIAVARETNTIWLNASKIDVRTAQLTKDGKTRRATVVSGPDDFLGLRFASPIAAGAAVLHLEYAGQIRGGQPVGIFSGEDHGNKYLFTQFEAVDARDAFPCFDEPAYKVPWQLTLHVPATDEAVSNTLVDSQKVEGATKTVVFRQTKPLPSYLIAFAVGPFEYVDGGRAGQNHVPIRIIVPKGRTAEAAFAAKNTARMLDILEAYFGIPYPFDKSDQLCLLKADFGAMENAGLVTYEAPVLLAKLENDSIKRQREYVLVALHELAHQWFGDLVTLQWWDDTWLNEAFASWMEHKMRVIWNPEWGHWQDIVDLQGAESTDTLTSARRIHQPILTPGDVNTAFDGITYDKGAAVIGMFESWIGPAVFRAAVQSYLRHHAFQNATTNDLLDALNTASHRDVKTAFTTFVDQPGIPLVSVKQSCHGSQASLRLEQHRMVSLGSTNVPDPLWQIPVCANFGVGGSERKACELLTSRTQDWTLPVDSCPTWLDANAGAQGYYRVAYDGPLFEQLAKPEATKNLDAAEKADFVANAGAVASVARLPYAQALTLVPLFAHDPNASVLETTLNLALSLRGSSSSRGGLRGDILPASSETQFQHFIAASFGERAHALGWKPKPGESEQDKELREVLEYRYTVFSGDSQLAAEAKGLVEGWLRGERVLDPQQVASALRAHAAFGDAAEAARYRNAWKQSTDLQDKDALLTALRYFRDPEAVRANLRALLSKEIQDDIGRTLSLVLPTPQTIYLPFEFVQANFSEVQKLLPFFVRSDLPSYVGGAFCESKPREDLKSFFEPHQQDLPGSDRGLAQTLERVDACIAEKGAQQGSIESFLRAY